MSIVKWHAGTQVAKCVRKDANRRQKPHTNRRKDTNCLTKNPRRLKFEKEKIRTQVTRAQVARKN
jgi:hypothetical protein